MINAIVAVDNDWGIGFNGELLEHIPEDLKYFKELTMNNIVVMGRKTWDSLPKKPLPNRFNIVISNSERCITSEGAARISLNEAKNRMTNNEVDWFVIGGGQIYKQLLPLCDKVYITKIYKNHENVDTYFPNLDKSNEWSGTPIGEIKTYKDLQYQFWVYERI